MNAKVPIFFCFLFIYSHSFAQRQNVYFFKNSGNKVSSADSADFTRIVSEPDSGSVLYNVKEYYKNGKPKLIGKSSTVDPIKLEESCLTNYPNGKKKQVASYKSGRLEGDIYNFFPNGRVYNYIKYLPFDVKSEYDKTYLIMASNDSTGKELVVEGTGHYIDYGDDFKYIFDEGEVKSGFKDGQWKGVSYSTEMTTGVETYLGTRTEIYQDGHFISGESVDKDGKINKYTIKEKEPQFKGGISLFYKYLNRHIIYPNRASQNYIQGRVSVQFVVERDGSLSGVKVVRSPNDDLSAEAIRVIKNCPKWEPGYQNGFAVRVLYTVPVNFSLGASK